MILLVFLLVALLITLLYAALAGTAALWSLALVFALGFLAANLLFVLLISLYSLTLPPLPPGVGVERQNPVCRWICALFARWLGAWARLRVQIAGREKLPDGPFLFICNHRSMFDPLSVMAWLPEKNISFVSKPSNLKIPVVGIVTRHAGFLVIDREDNREALKSILLAADYLKRGLCSIGIYPEGTRSRTGELLPFHAGSFKIAQKAAAPVLIACVSGSEQVKKRWPWRATTIRLELLELVDAGRVSQSGTNELAAYAHDIIAARLRELEGEGESI